METTVWKILLVEDDEEDYFLTRQMLLEARRGKFTLQWAPSFHAGQEALRTGTFDAVLVDFDLGARTGIDLVREALTAGVSAPMILLTGRGSYDVDIEAMQAGAVDYLTKADITPAFLERSIRFAIEHQRSESELAQANLALARANTELQQERARLQALVESAPSGIILTDREGKFIISNPANARLFGGGVTGDASGPSGGYTLHHTDGRPFHPDTLPLVQTLATGQPRQNQEILIRHANGSETIVLTNTAPVRGPDGTLEGAVAVMQDISDRKRIETERERLLEENVRYQSSLEQQRALLEQQNQLLEQIVEYAPAGIALLQGEDYHFTLVNPAYQAIARGKGDMLGRPLRDVWPEIYEPIVQLFHEVEESGEPISRINQLLMVNRGRGLEEGYFTFTFSPLFDDYGAVEGVMILVVETTELVKYQQHVEAERAWLEAVLQELPVAVWVADPDGKILTANRAAEMIFGGFAPLADSIAGYSAYQGRWPDTGREIQPEEWPLARAIHGERVTSVEQEIFRFDGKTATILTSAAPIYEGGSMLGAVTAAQDITERRALENALRQSEERNRQLLETTYEGVWTLNEDGSTRNINDRGAAILGYTVEEIQGRSITDIFFVEDLEDPLPGLDGTASARGEYREWRVRQKNGVDAWILTSSAPLLTPNGEYDGALVMFTDISDRKRAERHSRFLNDLGRSLLEHDDPDDIVRLVVESTASFFNADRAVITEVVGIPTDPTEQAFTQRLYEYMKEPLQKPIPVLGSGSSITLELAKGEPLIIEDAVQHPLTRDSFAVLKELDIASLVSLPRMSGDRWQGTLTLAFASARAWLADEITFLRAVSDLTWLALGQARYFQDLRTLEERFRVALSQIPVTVFTLDSDLKTAWSYNARAVVSGGVDLLQAPAAQTLLRVALGGGETVQKEIQINGPESSHFLLTVEPLRDEDGSVIGLTGAAVDVTGQRRLEARQVEYATLMEVQRRLLEQREMERQQIARDLHDGPIQDTMGLIFAIQAATDLTESETMLKTLAGLREEATKLVSELRGVCNELRPPVLARFGLERAIQAHARDFQERNPQIALTLDLAEDGHALSEDVRLALYRIYQESLNNVVRHAAATQVTVRLDLVPGAVMLEVRDNGKGAQLPGDWLELARTGHLGLVGMKERAEAVGGTLEIQTAPGRGTRLRVRIPWK